MYKIGLELQEQDTKRILERRTKYNHFFMFIFFLDTRENERHGRKLIFSIEV